MLTGVHKEIAKAMNVRTGEVSSRLLERYTVMPYQEYARASQWRRHYGPVARDQRGESIPAALAGPESLGHGRILFSSHERGRGNPDFVDYSRDSAEGS